MALSRLGRLLVVGVVLSAFMVMMSITIQPMPQYSIDEIMDNTDTYVGERIHIRGTIVNGTLESESSIITLVGIEETMNIDISKGVAFAHYYKNSGSYYNDGKCNLILGPDDSGMAITFILIALYSFVTSKTKPSISK